MMTSEPEWMGDAKCRRYVHRRSTGGGVDWFDLDHREAASICETCPVRAACAERVLRLQVNPTTRPRAGVWAGKSFGKDAKPTTYTSAADTDRRHGDRAGYEQHLRRREDACEPCAEANRNRNRALPRHADDYDHAVYICGEVEHLAGSDTPERIAVQLGYAAYDSLRAMLKRWRRRDLLELMERTAS